MEVFSGQTTAEQGTLPSEVALRQLLEAGSIPYAHRGSWCKIAESADVAEFTRGRLSGGYLEWVQLRFEGGRWKYGGNASDCDPTSVVGGGPVVTWTLDQGRVATDVVRKIRVNLGPGPCDGGRPQNPRARPVFQRYGKRLLLTIWLKPLPPGFYTCPAISEPPKTIILPRRMRIGRLLDGGTYPPTPPRTPGLRTFRHR